MRLLLDAHTILWFAAGDPQLSAGARTVIEDTSNRPVVSIASVWEMAIKVSLGKLGLGMDLATFVQGHITGNGIELLSITPAHIAGIISLPFHHRDPFDRLLIAQALAEGIPIVGCDSHFASYGVTLVW